MRYPLTPRSDAVVERHGHRVPDPYRPLEADGPQTAAWTRAQDELAGAWFGAREEQREQWRTRLAGLARPVIGLPREAGERTFFTRHDLGAEHPVLVAAEPDGTERTVLDPAALSEAATVTLDLYTPSPDGRLIAAHTSDRGDDWSSLRVYEVDGGREVEPPLETGWSREVAWLPDASGFCYQRPAGSRARYEVRLHRLGTPWADDPVVVPDQGIDGLAFELAVDPSGGLLAAAVHYGSNIRCDVLLVDLATGAATDVHKGLDCLSHVGFAPDGRLLVMTTLGAPRWRLAAADPARPQPEHWVDVIPEGKDILYAYAVTGDGILAAHWHDVVARLHRYDPAGAASPVEIPLPGAGKVEIGDGGAVSYTDHVTPVHRLGAGAERVPGVAVTQLFATSLDGTRIPMFLLSPEGVPEDAPLPTIVEGYGGWNVPWPPAYKEMPLAWVLAGGRYAVTNLRGGGEYGADWFLAGMRGAQQNPVDDFLACARLLVARGATTRAMLGALGGSKGGLTVGASITQDPGLFAAAVMSAPMLDMVRYEELGGSQWTNGFGTAEDPVEFGWLRDISALGRVREGVAYPDALFTVFDHDTRVHPAHARKMCAALQAGRAEDAGPVLYRRKPEAGHGARSATRARDLFADQLVFMADRLGLV